MKGKRQSTVEPVFGTLTQFMGLRKINTIGLKQANKVMHLSAIAYNLKKYLKFVQKRSKSGAGMLALEVLYKSTVQFLLGASVKYRKSQGFVPNPRKTLRFLTRLHVGDSHRRLVVFHSGKAPTACEIAMRPKQPQPQSDDFFRSSLEAIVDPSHELIGLSALIDWGRFDDAFGALYHDRKGRHGLPTRLMAGLHLLKHMKGLSDEETCAAWLENPYFQAFCGEMHFQHRLPIDRSSMTRWRQRIGANDLEALLAETIAVAVKTTQTSARYPVIETQPPAPRAAIATG